MITLVRVDNRLIHGQVVEAWLPHLKVARVVVADDEAAQSELIRAAMGLAVSNSVQVAIDPLRHIDYPKLATDERRTLVLFRDVSGVIQAVAAGLKVSRLNLGNVHFASGRRQVSASVFLSQDELNQLRMLSEEGVEVEARGVPTDRAVSFPEMVQRFEKSA